MTDLVGGQIQYMFSPLQNALPYIQQGRIKALAVAAKQRNRTLPDVPTLSESGYRGAEVANWFAVYAPAATPAAVVKKLNAAFVKVKSQPEMRAKLEDLLFATPDQEADFMRAELVRWARVAANAGIKAE
jgi:tripartite-type tricarboxylate transporter receptor subunit TctC